MLAADGDQLGGHAALLDEAVEQLERAEVGGQGGGRLVLGAQVAAVGLDGAVDGQVDARRGVGDDGRLSGARHGTRGLCTEVKRRTVIWLSSIWLSSAVVNSSLGPIASYMLKLSTKLAESVGG